MVLGRHDAMERQTLLPIQKHIKNTSSKNHNHGKPLQVLNAACGTGRFGTFLCNNFPDCELTQVGLSPFALEQAQSNDNFISIHGAKKPPSIT